MTTKTNDQPVRVTLHNGNVWEGTVTRRGRLETRMTQTNGRLTIFPTAAIASEVPL